jgi:hypothetical protein
VILQKHAETEKSFVAQGADGAETAETSLLSSEISCDTSEVLLEAILQEVAEAADEATAETSTVSNEIYCTSEAAAEINDKGNLALKSWLKLLRMQIGSSCS